MNGVINPRFHFYMNPRDKTVTIHRIDCSFAQRRDDTLGKWVIRSTIKEVVPQIKGHRFKRCSYCS